MGEVRVRVKLTNVVDEALVRRGQLLGRPVQFVYPTLDRVVLNGYLPSLQTPVSVVDFFREVGGVACIEPAVLAERTERDQAA